MLPRVNLQTSQALALADGSESGPEIFSAPEPPVGDAGVALHGRIPQPSRWLVFVIIQEMSYCSSNILAFVVRTRKIIELFVPFNMFQRRCRAFCFLLGRDLAIEGCFIRLQTCHVCV
jgi:hypothetical protein